VLCIPLSRQASCVLGAQLRFAMLQTRAQPSSGTESACVTGMWVNNEQRDRIFEMIGTHSAAPNPVPSARLEHQRVSLVLWLATLIGVGIAVLAL
jgi:hypothetical protein